MVHFTIDITNGLFITTTTAAAAASSAGAKFLVRSSRTEIKPRQLNKETEWECKSGCRSEESDLKSWGQLVDIRRSGPRI